MRKFENLIRQKYQNYACDARNVPKSILAESLTEKCSHTYTTFIKVDANRNRAKVSKYLQVSRIGIPNLEIKKEEKYQSFDESVWFVEIICEKQIQLIERPWDNFYDCHHEKEWLKNVVDEECVSLRNVLEEVKFDFFKNVLPKCHENGIMDRLGVKFLLQFYKVSIYKYINVIDQFNKYL